MRKIMFICNGLSNGGAERVISILANKLNEQGNEVYVLAFSKTDNNYEISEKINVIIAQTPKNEIKRKIFRIKEIRKVAIENKIDVIIAFSNYNAMSAVFAKFGTKIKVIGFERNDPAKIRKITSILRNILYRKLDYLVCQTEDAKKFFPKSVQKKSVVILNPLKDNLPNPYTEERENKIVSFARFEPQKNVPMIINAFEQFHKKFPQYTLELYGQGSEKEQIIELINKKQLNNSVFIYPFTTQIHQKVLKSKMFVLASNYEGLSNSMLEAMAIGLPTIVTDCPCGGARMVIQNKVNGILIPVEDTDALEKAMELVASDRELADKMGKNAVKVRSDLSPENIIRLWNQIIDIK